MGLISFIDLFAFLEERLHSHYITVSKAFKPKHTWVPVGEITPRKPLMTIDDFALHVPNAIQQPIWSCQRLFLDGCDHRLSGWVQT